MGADPLINLHTHTTFSDGDFTAEQIVSTAENHGLSHIAITDHFATTKVRSLPMERLEEYIGVITDLKEKHRKLNVLVGVEIDANPYRCDLDSLPIDQLNQLDLVLFEYVQSPDGTSLEDLGMLLESLKVPCGLAHNDLERNFKGWSPVDIADYIASFGVFVEINSAWPYARDGAMFWEKAEKHYQAFKGKVKVSVGTDVHHNLSEVYNLDKPYQFLRKNNLLSDLVLK
jgi:histidinol phosphatase-like PHP family hydrolase